ncbi:subtilase family protein [Yoonia maricola]|uniref:Subtilase family protein n=2 Tax=Yoonia maricola TaxID=420999 RepID=A0A2M8W0J5_9RHOB|nr:subtilase family protein [Yoonia maricola]
MRIKDKERSEKRPSGQRWQGVAERGATSSALDFRLAQQEAFTQPRDREKGQEVPAIWYSALLDLRETSIAAFVKKLDGGLKAQLHIPSDYTAEDRKTVFKDKLVVVFATAEVLRALNWSEKEYSVASVILGAVIDPDFINLEAKQQKAALPTIKVPNGTVITAVIDDGIAFGNDVFRDGLTSTRVAYATVLPTMPGTAPGLASVGVELDKAQIDALLVANTSSKLLDEDRFYQQAGVIDYADGTFSPTSLRRSHGTHITALAAGYPMDAAPDDRPILCAILPTRVTEDVSGGSILPSLVLALHRLTRQAARFRCKDGTRPPAVFNFSYGNFGGPHDGTSAIARAIEDYFGPSGPHCDPDQELRLVLPAGNGNLSRTHAKLAFNGGGNRPAKTLDFVAMPDDRTASEVQLWMPYSGATPLPNFVTVRATTPDGLQSGPVSIAAGSYQSLLNDQGIEVARLSFAFAPLPTARGLITLTLNPTESLTPAPLAPAGRWKIEVTPDQIAPDEDVQVWVERDDTLPGFRRGGRQPYFNNANYERFDKYGAPLAVDPPGTDSLIRRAGTLSGFACGPSPLVIGALVQSNGKMSDYSAAGPITPPRGEPVAYRDGPDASARGDDSPVLLGVLSAGSRSGSMVRLNGTSVAAPRVARFTANKMATGADGDRAWVQAQAGLQDADFPPPTPEAIRTGAGRLDISAKEVSIGA